MEAAKEVVAELQGCGGRGWGQRAHVNAAVRKPTVTDEVGERAQLFTAIDNPGAPQQYAVTHQGEEFKLLIDCGSTHSYLSPRCLRKLKLDQYQINPMKVELANGKEVISWHMVGTVDFEIGKNQRQPSLELYQ